MKLSVNLKSFTKEYIIPIQGINKTKDKVAIFTEGERIYSVSTSDKDTVYLYGLYKPLGIEDPIERFNINILKLMSGVSCIKDENAIFDIDPATLNYKDSRIKFNIRLPKNEVVNIPKINNIVTKFRTFDDQFSFTISKDNIKEILKVKAFAAATTKFYIEPRGDKVCMMFGDKTMNHTDNSEVIVSDAYTGKINENIFNISILDLIMQNKNDIILKVCTNNLLIMSSYGDNSELHYITTQLKK